jgi:subtilisin family serine protease
LCARRPHVEALEDRCLLASSGSDWLCLDAKSCRSDRILVQFLDGQAFSTAGSEIGEKLGGYHEVRLPENLSVAAALAAYQADPRVLAAQPDYLVQLDATPNDPSFGSLWGLHNTGQSGGVSDADIDAPAAWDVTVGSGQTVVAVIDTGVDWRHPDLAANIWTNPGEIAGNGYDDDGNGYVDDVHGYDFVNDDGNPMDDNGHGTHVAGTIGAVGNNGRGVVGVNWNVQIMALKFLGDDGSGYTSDALRALNYAVANGATISNNSWGGGGFSSAMLAAIRDARSTGHIFVAAAGNDGSNNDSNAAYPANYDSDNVVSVAALDRYDNLASFSNYGASTVDIGAPGVGILSTTPNNTYSTYSGTSMAAPHVTGVLALVRDRHPDWTYRQVIDQVLSTATPVSALRNRTVTGGRVNAAAAAALPVSETLAPRVLDATTLAAANGDVSSVRITLSEAIDPATFTAADVTGFTGPAGAVVVNGVQVVTDSGNRQFDITFATQSTPGTYSLTVGPDIRDLAGNRLNQDGDGTFGEAVQDQFTATFTVRQAFTYASTDVNKPIFDFQRTVSFIDIGQDITIKDLNVQVNVLHTYDGDVKIRLISPKGVRVPLVKRRGNDGDDFTGTVFDDQAASSIAAGSAPFSGSYRPEAALSTYNGKNARGRWQLWIDDMAYGDSGWLSSWSLNVTAASTASQQQATRDASSAVPRKGVAREEWAGMLLLKSARKDLAQYLYPQT